MNSFGDTEQTKYLRKRKQKDTKYITMNGLLIGLLLPFAGTTLGAACVFLMKARMAGRIQKIMLGFAAGVMVAASVWSLLIPSIEMCGTDHASRVIPAVTGFAAGIAFLLLMDRITPHLHLNSKSPEGPHSHLSRTSMLALAVTLHNIPEGMAVGVTLSAALEHSAYLPMAGAIALSLGIAIQNFPEGAIIAMPLNRGTDSRPAHPLGGLLSHPRTALSAGIRGRRHDLCSGGRAYSGSLTGPTFEHGNIGIRIRLCTDDGVGCRVRLTLWREATSAPSRNVSSHISRKTKGTGNPVPP